MNKLKFLFIVFLFVNFSFAKILYLDKLICEIFPIITHKKIIKIYTLPKFYDYFKNKKFLLVKNCKRSDIVFGNIICDNKPVFALDYSFYKRHKQVIGVFYFRKGRPQLKFKAKELKKYFKIIPKEIKDYVE